MVFICSYIGILFTIDKFAVKNIKRTYLPLITRENCILFFLQARAPKKTRDQIQQELYLRKRSRKSLKTVCELDIDGLPFEPSGRIFSPMIQIYKQRCSINKNMCLNLFSPFTNKNSLKIYYANK